MKNTDPFLKNLWLWKCGLPEKDTYIPAILPSVESLEKTEWCPEFERIMRNRMIMGAFRYGEIRSGAGDIRRIYSAVKRLNMYLETGNKELLADVANLCMCEYMMPGHPDSHFNSVDDGEHWD
jgi:hypothetical protein